jgi:hypothetical protein
MQHQAPDNRHAHEDQGDGCMRRQQQAFSEVLAWSAKPFNLSQEGKGRYAEGLFVSGNFFNLLHVPAAAGRVFQAQDDQPGCGSPGVVVGYPFWHSEFNGDPAIANRTIRLDGNATTCVKRAPQKMMDGNHAPAGSL